MYTNLIFAGGGVKVIAHGGVIQYLEEKNYLTSITRLAGTSGGAIIALCLSLGYTATEIKDLLLEINFSQFVDNPDFLRILWGVVHDYGIHSMGYFKSFLSNLIVEKGFDKNISFKELHQQTHKELNVIAFNLNRQFMTVFNYQNTPDMLIADAVCMSGTVPIYFIPTQYQEDWYVDGGVVDNYPIELFDQNPTCRYSIQKLGSNQPNEESLGFMLLDPELIYAYQHHEKPPSFKKINNFLDFGTALQEAAFSSQDYKGWLEKKRTVFIDNCSVSMLDFNISLEKRNQLIDSGYQATKNFFTQVTK